MSRLLGAVLAGGQASRFGSDKAIAVLDGRSLIDLALATVAPHCAATVVVGRAHADVPGIPDLPVAGLGPLGGIAGALAHAAAHDFTAVLTTACDTPHLPAALVDALLAAGSGHAAEAPVVGLWPTRLARPLLGHLLAGGDRSIRRWATSAGLRAVLPGVTLANVNTPDDLCRLASAGRDRDAEARRT